MSVANSIAFDAGGVRSHVFRREVERTLQSLSLRMERGIWDALTGANPRFPKRPTILVGDLHELAASGAWDHWTAGPPWLFTVLLVRTTLDEHRLSFPDVALRAKDDRFFLLDVKCTGRRESASTEVMRDYFRAFVARLEPDRVLAARFSAVDQVMWVEFGDGLDRALEWGKLPFSRELGIQPVAAAAREHGQSVLVRDVAGHEIDIGAGSLRAVVDTEYRKRIEVEDKTEREAVGARIRAVREGLGLSQEEVSRRSGIPQESLSRIENGRRDPRLDTLRKLAKGFGLTLAQLLEKLSAEGQL